MSLIAQAFRMPRRALGRIRRQLTQHQRTTFLLASGLSTAGSFAGLTAKGWLLMEGSGNPFLLAANFALLTLPTLLVDEPEQLGPYLASFSVIFNVGKLVGPPIGGLLLAATGPTLALSLDAATYLLPILTLLWLMAPYRERERRSASGSGASLATAWRDCGPALRHVLVFCGLACLVGFFHPGLAPLMALNLLGPSPLALGLFTSVIACGSISAGVVLQRNAQLWSRRPGLLLGGSTVITALGQLGLSLQAPQQWGLAMAFLIGGGTASLLAGTNLIIQVHAPQVIRGRMAGLGQIAFLGGGGISGLMAAGLTAWLPGGLWSCFALLGSFGAALGVVELLRQGRTRLA